MSLERSSLQVLTGGNLGQGLSQLEQAVFVLDELGDEQGLARGWYLVGKFRAWQGDTSTAEEAWERALSYGGHPESRVDERETVTWLLIAAWYGPTPVPEGIERCRHVLKQFPSDRKIEAFAMIERAPLEAMRGRFGEARALIRRGRSMLDDLGSAYAAAGASQEAFDVEMLAGEPARVEPELRDACDTLEQMGDTAFLSTRAACLAEVLYAQARYAEADTFASISEAKAAQDDWDAQIRWRSVRAKLLARKGSGEEAELLAREAVRRVAETDWLNCHANTLMDLSEVLQLCGRAQGGIPDVRKALALYEQKDNIVSAARAGSRLAGLGP